MAASFSQYSIPVLDHIKDRNKIRRMAQWPAGQYLKVKGKNPLKMVFFGSSGHFDDPPGGLPPDLAPFADQDLAGGPLIPFKIREAVRVAALAVAVVAGISHTVR